MKSRENLQISPWTLLARIRGDLNDVCPALLQFVHIGEGGGGGGGDTEHLTIVY